MNENKVDKELRTLSIGLMTAGGILVVGALTLYAYHNHTVAVLLGKSLDKMLDAHINALDAYTMK